MAKEYLTSLLGQTERVVLIARRHWLALAAEIASEAVLTIAWLVLIGLLLAFTPLAAWGFLLVPLPLISLARDVLVWWNEQYVVTTRRVIRLAGVLSKDVTDSSLEKVNDVKMVQSALGRLLGYGDIEILPASELGVNKFRRLYQPVRFKTAMLDAKEQLERGGSRAGAPSVSDLLARLGELRQAGVLTEAEFQAKKAGLVRQL